MVYHGYHECLINDIIYILFHDIDLLYYINWTIDVIVPGSNADVFYYYFLFQDVMELIVLFISSNNFMLCSKMLLELICYNS